jgi:hypothetical protein
MTNNPDENYSLPDYSYNSPLKMGLNNIPPNKEEQFHSHPSGLLEEVH